MEEVGAVFAAHQINVIDTEVGWNLFVTGWLVMSFPFHPVGNPPSQTIRRTKKPDAVLPGGGEFEPETAIEARLRNSIEFGGPGVNQPVGPGGQGPVDIGEPEHRQARDDLGDLGAESWHFNC